MTKPNPIPAGYHTVTPFLAVADARAVIAFATAAFAAEELFVMTMDDGTPVHAELQVGDSRVMVGQVSEAKQAFPAMLYMYVGDVDAVYAKAVEAGGKTVREPTDEIYGDRNAAVTDPGGNQWWIATHIEDVSNDEIARRMRERAAAK